MLRFFVQRFCRGNIVTGKKNFKMGQIEGLSEGCGRGERDNAPGWFEINRTNVDLKKTLPTSGVDRKLVRALYTGCKIAT